MANFTAQAIRQSFMKLLNEYPLSKISVRSIVEDCGINRNSFYYHYRDIPALIEDIICDEVDQLIAQYPAISTLDEGIEVALAFAVKNKKAVGHIYNSVNRDIFEKQTMKLCEYVATRYLETVLKGYKVSDYDRRIGIRGLKCILFGLTFDWIESGMSAEHIQEVYHANQLCHGIAEEIISRAAEAESLESPK